MAERKESKGIVRFIKADVIRGLKTNTVKYAVMFLFVIVSIYMLNRMITSHQQIGDVCNNAGFFDYLLYLVQGTQKYIPGKSSTFQIPVLWMVMNIIPAFLVCSYAVRDMEGQGMYMLLKNRSRRVWWLSKCIWNVVTVTLLYVIVWGTLFLGTVLGHHSISGIWTIHKDICEVIMEMPVQSMPQAGQLPVDIYHSGLFLLAVIIVPFVISMEISLIQMTFSLIIGPVISFMVVVIICVLSAYFMNPLLLENYTMLMRSNLVLGNSGMNLMAGVIAAIVLGSITILLGFRYFSRMDIMAKE